MQVSWLNRMFSRVVPVLALGALMLSSIVRSAQSEEEEDLPPLLTEETFTAAVTEKPQFVMFFAPWCGHCKRLAPTWQEIHAVVSGGYSDSGNAGAVEALVAGIARVDCTTQTALCAQHRVTGYPTLMLFKGPEHSYRYKGPRELSDLLGFLSTQLSSKDLESGESDEDESPREVAEYTADTFASNITTGHHFIMFYAPWCAHCQRLGPTWDRLAAWVGGRRRVTVGKVDCAQHRTLCAQHGVRGYPTLLWFTDGKQVGEKYAGERSLDALQSHIIVQAKRSATSAPGPTAPDPATTVEDEVAEPVVVEEKGEQEEDEEEWAERSEAEEEVGINAGNGGMAGGGGKTLAGGLFPSGPVVVLTAESFDAGVADGLTLVKFFAPWCGHCKEMVGAYEELARQLTDHAITVAEVDCTAHNNRDLCTTHQVKGFPSIVLYRAGARSGLYDGDRSTQDMVDFVTTSLAHEEL